MLKISNSSCYLEDNTEIQEVDGYEATDPDQEPIQAKKKRKKDVPYIGWDLYFHNEGNESINFKIFHTKKCKLFQM